MLYLMMIVRTLPVAGVVPACGSIDCLSVFALNTAEGACVASVMASVSSYPADPTLRLQPALDASKWAQAALQQEGSSGEEVASFAFAAPADDLLDFSGPRGAQYSQACKAAFAASCERCAC